MIFWLALGVGAATSAAQLDLSQLSLEELLEIEVTSAARKQQPLARTPAAVYVITQQELRRSGFTTLAEALRLAPGLQVARVNSSTWAISARGFNSILANKLLVLIDGRSVYTPLYSGVYWELQDLPLELIERIEVIRGPGATMWGANAVNGVINIITKHARDTQGGQLTLGGGSHGDAIAALHFGGKAGSNLYYRFYTKVNRQGEFLTAAGEPAGDPWSNSWTGVRADWEIGPRDALTVVADAALVRSQSHAQLPLLTSPYRREASLEQSSSAGNVLARWTHRHRRGAVSNLQFYYDRYDRALGIVTEARDTVELDYQHRSRPAARHELLWGFNLRHSTDDAPPSDVVSLVPRSKTIRLSSAFAADEIELVRERVWLEAGVRLERSSFLALEAQPTARILYAPAQHHHLWAAVSRAVRAPSRGERSGNMLVSVLPPIALVGSPAPPLPVAVRGVGNPAFGPAGLVSVEGGYRGRPRPSLSVDLAVFLNRYRGLRSLESLPLALATEPVLHWSQRNLFTNYGRGHSAGVEAVVRWQASPSWSLTGIYSYLGYQAALEPFADPLRSWILELGQAPRHQGSLRASWDPTSRWQLDAALYYTGLQRSLPNSWNEYPPLPGAWRADLRAAWSPRRDLELSLTGQNLLDDRRPEFHAEIWLRRHEVRRGLSGQVRWWF
jgi:iron complex outermembrane receptor protein